MSGIHVSAGVAATPPYSKEPRSYDWQRGPAQGHDPGAGATRKALIDHPAVRCHGKGVQTEELVNFIDCLNNRVVARVRGTGAEQYAREQQAFEKYPTQRLVEETLDELADVIAYTAMLSIKLLAAVREAGR